MKGKCIIVGAGEIFQRKIQAFRDDYIIAADGGYKHLKKQNINPHIFIGDMDSYSDIPLNCKSMILPKEKNDTDVFAAVNYAIEIGYNEFYFYGCSGGNSEHTFANYQILNYLADKNKVNWIIGNRERITAIKNSALTFDKNNKGRISVFALSESAVVTLIGLKYPLNKYLMTNKYPIGTSNEFIEGQSAEILVEAGTVLIFAEENN